MFKFTPTQHRHMGIELNLQAWKLLGQTVLEAKAKVRLEHFALGSLHHWNKAEGREPTHEQRGHWLVSRVYCVLGRGPEALVHADRCLALTERHRLADFDLAYAHEAVARARASSGDLEGAEVARTRAAELGAEIEGDKDREIFEADLQAKPWFGLPPAKAAKPAKLAKPAKPAKLAKPTNPLERVRR